jgi:phosphoribosyl-ATP pyrophosphohydrolase
MNNLEAMEAKGYHLRSIEKGILGDVSKIKEEVEELLDANEQGSLIMCLVECSDIYGALEAYVQSKGLTMQDLELFSEITKRAFRNGKRN